MKLLTLILIWPIFRGKSLTKRITKEPIVCNIKRLKANVRQCIEPTWWKKNTERWNKKSKQVNKSWRRMAQEKRLKNTIQKNTKKRKWIKRMLYLIRCLFVQHLKYKISPDLKDSFEKKTIEWKRKSSEKKGTIQFSLDSHQGIHAIHM